MLVQCHPRKQKFDDVFQKSEDDYQSFYRTSLFLWTLLYVFEVVHDLWTEYSSHGGLLQSWNNGLQNSLLMYLGFSAAGLISYFLSGVGNRTYLMTIFIFWLRSLHTIQDMLMKWLRPEFGEPEQG